MKFRFFFSTLFFIGLAYGDEFYCDSQQGIRGQGPVCYTLQCAEKISSHISKELDAAFHYLYMAAYFDQDSVNRPGLAKFLYEAASEERGHAMMMLDYLSLRGLPFESSYYLNQNDVEVPDTLSYKGTLELALNMEIKVTDAIHKIIEVCEKDFHGADVFTDPVLQEQHEGIRKLKGLVKAFDDMALGATNRNAISLAEYLFDKKLLEGTI